MSHAHAIGVTGTQTPGPGDGEHGPAGRDTLSVAAPPVEVLRNSGLAAAVGSLASAIAIAYLARATTGGFWLDWVMALVMGGLGAAYLLAFLDARTPLLVADAYGVRIRLGTSWRGLPWEEIARVEHQPRRGPLRDGRLVLVAREPERILAELDASGRRQSSLAKRLYGAPLAVPLALSTRVTGAGDDLTAALVRLAGDESLIVELADAEAQETPEVTPPTPLVETVPVLVKPSPALEQAPLTTEPDLDADLDADVPDVTALEATDQPTVVPAGLRRLSRLSWSDTRAAASRLAAGISAHLVYQRADAPGPDATEDVATEDEADLDDLAAGVPDDGVEHTAPIALVPLVPSATPSPLREPAVGVRAEVTLEPAPAPVVDAEAVLPEHELLHRPVDAPLAEDEAPDWRTPDHDAALADLLIGERIADARSALCLSVDELAEHTRIRPHVIEAIERDDFAPCGGDFYARGHLRTIARVLCIDATPLLAEYDAHHADAPIDPRRIFEAELANVAQGPIRGTRGRTNWSVLVAAVMAVVLVWSVARLLMDSPAPVTMPAPHLNGSAGPSGASAAGKPVPVVLTAPRGGAHVVVRDGNGDVAYLGDLAFGETRTIERVKPPVRVQSSDGSVEVTINGDELGALGATGQPAQNLFPAGTDN